MISNSHARSTAVGTNMQTGMSAPPPCSISMRTTRRNPHTAADRKIHKGIIGCCANDPSAGSPTETLLRLLLPLSVKVHQTFHCNVRDPNIAAVRIIHRNTQSVGATGGVYKGQGRNQHELMIRALPFFCWPTCDFYSH